MVPSKIAELKDIALFTDGKKILQNINLELKKGEITTLIGPNGGGKTSIARILLGILKPTKGKIIKSKNIKIGYMPQKISFDKTIPLSAKDFIKLSIKKVFFDENLIKLLGVENILEKQIQDLSGGQLQKILLIRALATNPDLLVLDEPTQYMDIKAIDNFYQILEEIRKQKHCAILLISHDLLAIMQKTDAVFCINNHICCHGSPDNINNHPEYISLFGSKSSLGIYKHHHDHNH